MAALAVTAWLAASSARAAEPPVTTAPHVEAPTDEAARARSGSVRDPGKSGSETKLPSKAEKVESLHVLVLMLAAAGVLGGYLGYLRERGNPSTPAPSPDGAVTPPAKRSSPKPPTTARLAVVQGLVAAEVVPFFLSLTQSTLLDEALAGEPVDVVVLFGLGLIAAAYSTQFLNNISNAVLSERVAQAQENALVAQLAAKEAENRAAGAERKAEGAARKAEEADRVMRAGRLGQSRHHRAPKEAMTPEQAIVGAFARSEWDLRTIADIVKDDALELFRADGEDMEAKVRAALDELCGQGMLLLHAPDASVKEERWSLTTNGWRQALSQ